MSSAAATMSSVQAFREFINQRLTAAALEIFTVFERTIVQYEEQMDRQRRLMDSSWTLHVNLHSAENSQQHTTTGVQLCEEENPGAPPQCKEEQETLCISRVEMQVEVKQEPDVPEQTELPGDWPVAADGGQSAALDGLLVPRWGGVDSQCHLLDIVQKPHIELHRIDCPHKHVGTKEQLCHKERSSTSSQEEQEEQEEPSSTLQTDDGDEEELSDPGEDDAELISTESAAAEAGSLHGGGTPSPSGGGQTDARQTDAEAKTDGGARPRKRTLFCQTCRKRFPARNELLRHLRTHTGEKPYRCQTCGKTFRQKSHFLTHNRIHTDERPYGCWHCGERFRHRASFLNHTRIHTGEKPYVCDECGRSFVQRAGLLAHVRVHTGEKPYVCDECGRSFSQRSSWSNHKRTHSGEKPHSCQICNKGFSQRASLLRHMIKHTE